MFGSVADIHQQQQQAQQRLLSGQQQQEYTEDKKCRICGFADTKNVNIFSQTSCKALVTKILTVYPIVLYKNDPLPKNICKKCICNVSIMYNDILRVMKTQSKWIKNVRNVQPRHNYIRVLDMIENSNNVTKDSIKASLGEEINELTVERLLLSNKVDFLPTESIIVSKETNTPPKLVAPILSAPSQITSLSFSMDFDDNVVKTIPHSTTPKSGETAEMKDIKSLLELNGCSLLQVGANKTTTKSSTQLSNDSGDAPIINIKKEKIDAEENDEHKILDLMPSPSTSKNCSISSIISPGPPPPLTIKCRMCPLQFNSLASLATHQVIHMRLCVPKIFQKKYLHKKIRRGRLISVNGRKCIRCLNCWRILVDNKSILEHWAMGECDFYCHICGKEFAQAPKMLREHVPAAHGISYKSSKFHRVRLSTKVMMSMAQTSVKECPDYKLYQAASEQEPLPLEGQGGKNEISKEKYMKPGSSATAYASTKYKKSSKSGSSPGKTTVFCNEDGSVACHICSKVFQNFKARNSHMRKHKPVYAYGDMVLPPLQGVNVYMKEQAKNNEFKYRSPGIEIASQQTNYQNNTSTPPAPTPPVPTPPLTSSPQTSSAANTCTKPFSAVRGVRTKFVQPREFNGGTLKVKPLNELQKQSSGNVFDSPSTFSSSNPFPSPSSSSTTSNAWLSTAPNISNNQNHSEIDPLVTKIKEEPVDLGPTESSAQNPPQHHQEPQHRQQQQHQQQQNQQQQHQQQQHQQQQNQQEQHQQQQQQQQHHQQQHHQQQHHHHHQQQQQQQPTVFTCIPCSEQFPSKLELFRHKRKCHAAYSFTCVYCLALFRCSADYQLHVAQVHRKYS